MTQKTTARIHVRATHRRGFYRCGRHWPFEGVEAEVDEDTFTRLVAEPNLVVRDLEHEAEVERLREAEAERRRAAVLAKPSMEWNKRKLADYARSLGIVVGGKWSKEEILNAIRVKENPELAPPENDGEGEGEGAPDREPRQDHKVPPGPDNPAATVETTLTRPDLDREIGQDESAGALLDPDATADDDDAED